MYSPSLDIKKFLLDKYNIDKNCFNNFLFNIDIQKTKFSSIITFAHYIPFKTSEPLDCPNIQHLINSKYDRISNATIYYDNPDFKLKDTDIFYYYKIYFDIQKTFPKGSKTYIKCLQPNLEALKIFNKYSNKMYQSQEKLYGNIFKYIDKFVYIKSGPMYDRHPRMFQECFYHNIPIDYYNLLNSPDGSTYRYKDVIENGIQHRFLKDTDIVINRFLS